MRANNVQSRTPDRSLPADRMRRVQPQSNTRSDSVSITPTSAAPATISCFSMGPPGLCRTEGVPLGNSRAAAASRRDRLAAALCHGEITVVFAGHREIGSRSQGFTAGLSSCPIASSTPGVTGS